MYIYCNTVSNTCYIHHLSLHAHNPYNLQPFHIAAAATSPDQACGWAEEFKPRRYLNQGHAVWGAWVG